jgi:hypothetical protein
VTIRVRRPDVDRLELSAGDFLIVKRYLTAGEFRQFQRATIKPIEIATTVDPRTQAAAIDRAQLDPIEGGIALVMAYLVDWSFCDAEGRPMPIVDQPPSVVRSALDHITADAYLELEGAIQRHHQEIQRAIAAEKKSHSLPADSPLTLTSVG